MLRNSWLAPKSASWRKMRRHLLPKLTEWELGVMDNVMRLSDPVSRPQSRSHPVPTALKNGTWNPMAETGEGLDVLVFSLLQDSLAGPARQSTARMELEGPQGLREKQAGQACQAPWGCQASVSLQPALEPQPMPPHASRNLDPSKGHEHEARIEPGGHPGGKGLGSLWVDMHPSPQTRKPASPGPSILDPGVLRKRKF